MVAFTAYCVSCSQDAVYKLIFKVILLPSGAILS